MSDSTQATSCVRNELNVHSLYPDIVIDGLERHANPMELTSFHTCSESKRSPSTLSLNNNPISDESSYKANIKPDVEETMI